MDNKRTFPRFSLGEAVVYQRPTQSAPTGSLAANISLGGLKLSVAEFVPVGTVLKMQINFSNPPRTVVANGKVVWVKEVGYGERYEIGLEFLREHETLQALSSVFNARRYELI
jgi:hypothetical protein